MFIIPDKTTDNLVGEEVKGVGVMKDEELKLEERICFRKVKGLVEKKNHEPVWM